MTTKTKYTAFFDEETLQGDIVVACPVCGGNYSHIRDVFTRKGSDEHEAAIYKGTREKGQVGARRSCLVVVFEGECGHFFEWQIQQHKGNNIFNVEAAATENKEPKDEWLDSGKMEAASRHQALSLIEGTFDKWDLVAQDLGTRVNKVLVGNQWFSTWQFHVHGDVASWDEDAAGQRMIVFVSEIRAIRFSGT